MIEEFLKLIMQESHHKIYSKFTRFNIHMTLFQEILTKLKIKMKNMDNIFKMTTLFSGQITQ